MIGTIEELNNVVNDVVNRIVAVSTEKTSTGQWYASHADVADLISKEDFLKYFDFIAAELQSREELLDLEITKDHEFDGNYGLAWCPNYEWVEGDEAIFHMAKEEYENTFVAEKVSQPLSITRKAEILDGAMRNIQAALEELPQNQVSEIAELFCISTEELAKLDLPAAKEALAEAQNGAKNNTQYTSERNYDLPIEFELIANHDLSQRQLFDTFEDALAAYKAIPEGVEKELGCQTYRFQHVVENNILMRSNGDGKDWVNDCVISNDAHVQLASAKAMLSHDATNKDAWSRLNAAEAIVGVTGHRFGENDLRAGNWRVHLVPPNGKYGRDDCVTNNSGKYLVEFYDLRHIDPEFSPMGQFTGAQYYADTLLGKDGWGNGEYPYGLSLVADIPAWTVSAPQMQVIMQFIRENAAERPRTTLADLIRGAKNKLEEPSPSFGGKDDRGR